MATKKTTPAKKPGPRHSSGAKATGTKTAKKGGGGSATRVKAAGVSTERRALLAELTKLSGVMDDGALADLVQHARIMIHNASVIQQFEEGKKKRAEAAAAMGPDRASVEEGGNGSHFIIILHRYRNFFSRDEMKQVVRLCHAAADRSDGMSRLYAWFSRERTDVIKNSDIGRGDEQLGQLYDQVVSTYTTS